MLSPVTLPDPHAPLLDCPAVALPPLCDPPPRTRMNPQLAAHRSHDYLYLRERWADLCPRAGLQMHDLATISDYPLHWISSPAADEGATPAIYVSTGIHGDEPGSVWGLLEWAEENIPLFAAHPFLIFPCLNPYGLVHNTRVDEEGRDLNRSFHLEGHPLISAWNAVMEHRRVDVFFNLHEDYDAQGIYMYELSASGDDCGRRILDECGAVLPLDGRLEIEGRAATQGLILRRTIPEGLPGMPESIAAFARGVRLAITFESPSEFALTDRIAVHKAFLTAALRHACGISTAPQPT